MASIDDEASQHTNTRTHTADDYVHYKHDQNRTKWEVSGKNLPMRRTKPGYIIFQEAALYIREGEDNDKFYCHPRGKWSKVAYKILHHPIFHIFDLVLSVLLMLLALIEKPAIFGTEDDEKPIVSVSYTLKHMFSSNLQSWHT